MRSRSGRAIRGVLGVWLCLTAAGAGAKALYGKVAALRETEVLVLQTDAGEQLVRVYGIDAPEPGQPFAEQARQQVEQWLQGREVRTRFKYRNADYEFLCRVWVGIEPDAPEVAVELVRLGLAWRVPQAHYKPLAKGQPGALEAAETEARAARRGVWSEDNPTPPWEFRAARAAAGR